MYFIDMEDFISKKEKEIGQASEESCKQSDKDLAISVVATILAPPIFYGLKYIYSLLH